MKHEQKSNAELRKFGFTIAVALLLLASFLWWKERPSMRWVAAVGALFFLLGLLAPRLLREIEVVWMKLAELMGAVMTRVILAIGFFAVIAPFGIVIRLMRKDLLGTKIDKNRESYWDPVEVDGPGTRAKKPY